MSGAMVVDTMEVTGPREPTELERALGASRCWSLKCPDGSHREIAERSSDFSLLCSCSTPHCVHKRAIAKVRQAELAGQPAWPDRVLDLEEPS